MFFVANGNALQGCALSVLFSFLFYLKYFARTNMLKVAIRYKVQMKPNIYVYIFNCFTVLNISMQRILWRAISIVHLSDLRHNSL